MAERPDPNTPEVVLDGESLTPADVAAVARQDATVGVADAARAAVRESRERVAAVVESGEAVYGLNTGFGELVDERIPREEIDQLQTNLLRSHASGAGNELARESVRALMVTRVNALAKGYSGVRETVLDHLTAMLNAGVHPVVRSRGSLGASGDLAPLAHLALVLLGEGEATVDRGREAEFTDDGTRIEGDSDRDTGDGGSTVERAGRNSGRLPGEEALAAAGLEPLALAPKEGLALINGTQLTVGLAALSVLDAEVLCRAADVAGALTTEVTMGTTASCDPAIQDVRPHDGQAGAARNVRRLTAGSGIVESHRNCDRVQDAYSIRCLPQVHGAVRDAVSHLREAVTVELNSATDNPLVFEADRVARSSGGEAASIVSGGNFHGAPLAHRLDYAVAALTDLAAISERRTDRLLNPNLQEPHLPAFLAGDPGIESGYMIPQYTAAAMVSELRSIDRTATDTVPVSGNQEDHVSTSATGAFALRRAVGHARTAIAVELLCASEALEYVDDDLEPGTGTAAAYDAVRDVVAPLDGDRPLHHAIETVDALIAGGLLEDRVTAAVDDLD